MTIHEKPRRPISRRTAILLVLVAAIVVAVPTAFLIRKTDPARADSVLARLQVPADWRLASVEHDPAPISQSRTVRYYIVVGGPASVAATARSLLTGAGFAIEGRGSLPDCSSSGDPPATTCYLGAPLSGDASLLELVVFDRRGAAFLAGAPWFDASAQGQTVVRITVYY